MRRMKHLNQEKQRKDKAWDKSFNKLQIFTKEYETKAKRIERGMKERKEQEEAERLQ